MKGLKYLITLVGSEGRREDLHRRLNELDLSNREANEGELILHAGAGSMLTDKLRLIHLIELK